MTTEEALLYFQTPTRLASAAGVQVPSLYDWKTYPPPLRQLRLERVTKGELRAEPSCDEYRVEAAA